MQHVGTNVYKGFFNIESNGPTSLEQHVGSLEVNGGSMLTKTSGNICANLLHHKLLKANSCHHRSGIRFHAPLQPRLHATSRDAHFALRRRVSVTSVINNVHRNTAAPAQHCVWISMRESSMCEKQNSLTEPYAMRNEPPNKNVSLYRGGWSGWFSSGLLQHDWITS